MTKIILVIIRMTEYGSNLKKNCTVKGLTKKSNFFRVPYLQILAPGAALSWFWTYQGPISPNFCARRSVMMILNSSEKPAKLLSSYLPVSQSRVLRAPGTSPYHLVPKHLRTTWSRPEQSHLLPEACSPNGTDKRRQRQRQTERPPPEPSDIHKRFCALYDDKLHYYKKKVSKY